MILIFFTILGVVMLDVALDGPIELEDVVIVTEGEDHQNEGKTRRDLASGQRLKPRTKKSKIGGGVFDERVRTRRKSTPLPVVF